MLVHTDPFRALDRLSAQMLGMPGTTARPTPLSMDAWRDGDHFLFEFDVPGVDAKSIELDVERNVLTVRAERPELPNDQQMLTAERPRGVFSRQIMLGENLDTDHIEANYDSGVLTLRIPVAERAKPRRIEISERHGDQYSLSSGK